MGQGKGVVYGKRSESGCIGSAGDHGELSDASRKTLGSYCSETRRRLEIGYAE